MDSREEELREKLRALERDVIDPRLVGRGEEIWARMVNVRERGRMLQRELERIGGGASKGEEEKGKIPEEILERAQKVCLNVRSFIPSFCEGKTDSRRSSRITTPRSSTWPKSWPRSRMNIRNGRRGSRNEMESLVFVHAINIMERKGSFTLPFIYKEFSWYSWGVSSSSLYSI